MTDSIPINVFADLICWIGVNFEPEEIFEDKQLIKWAFENGFTKPTPAKTVTPSFWYDDQVEAIANDECAQCRKRFKIIEVFATSVDVTCDCGPSEFDLEPQNAMPEEMIHY